MSYHKSCKSSPSSSNYKTCKYVNNNNYLKKLIVIKIVDVHGLQN
jgi:hypothetical protein